MKFPLRAEHGLVDDTPAANEYSLIVGDDLQVICKVVGPTALIDEIISKVNAHWAREEAASGRFREVSR